jgi:nucleotide-binding universal stress UspA family protein
MSTEILIPLDGSALADKAVAHAAEIARRVDGALHLVRVYRPLRTLVVPLESVVLIPDPVLDERLRAEAETWLVQRARSVSELNNIPVTYELRDGVPDSEIVLAAEERRSRLIVCTTRGGGGAVSQWLGSVADGVIRHAHCPVLVMSPSAVELPVRLHSVLLLLDGSEASGAMILHAAWLARAFDAELRYHQFTPPPEDPGHAILEHISRTNPDAVALATHGRGVSRLFFDGVADEVVRLGGRPTLVFKPRDLPWTHPREDWALTGASVN